MSERGVCICPGCGLQFSDRGKRELEEILEAAPCDQCGRPAEHSSYGGGSWFHWCHDHPRADGSAEKRGAA